MSTARTADAAPQGWYKWGYHHAGSMVPLAGLIRRSNPGQSWFSATWAESSRYGPADPALGLRGAMV